MSFWEKDGMSEKRFKVCIDSNNGVGLFDNSTTLLFIKFTNKEDAVSCKDSLKYHCNLMNELYDESEQLKQQIEIEKKWQLEKDKYYVKMMEENEQLRKQVGSLETTSNATSHYNAFLESKISTLEKENDKLREELLDCEKFRHSVFKPIEKTIENNNNCVLNKDAKYSCKAYDECLKRQGTNKPLPCMVNWMMGRTFKNMLKGGDDD